MDITGDQRLLLELKTAQATTATGATAAGQSVTEKMAASILNDQTATLDNNSLYTAAFDIVNTPASSLLYWGGGGDGGGGVGVGGVGGGSSSSSLIGIGSSTDSLVEQNSLPSLMDAINLVANQQNDSTQTHLSVVGGGAMGVADGGAFGYDGSGTSFDYGSGNSTDYMAFSEHCQMVDLNSNMTYWNVTCDTPLNYAEPLYGLCMPFLLIITIISNSLIVIVLSKKHMATPTNFVLMVMAICDMLTVMFPAPGLWYMYVFGNHYKPLHPVSMCLTYSIFNEIMPAMCHTASIWLTLALAVQRYIYVCHAPMARTWCTMPRVKRCTLYIVLISMLHQTTRIFDRTYSPLVIEWNGQTTEVCHMATARWVYDYMGEDVYFTYYYLSRVIFVNLLPCIVLVTLNILLFRAMQQAQERRKLLFRENRKKECKKLRESNCTTLMLIVVVTVFLIVEIPIAVLTLLHIVSSLNNNFLDYSIANIFIIFTNFFLVASYPINFGIYCGMSRQFRETFKSIFFGRIFRNAKKDNSSKYSIVNGPRTTCSNTNETVL